MGTNDGPTQQVTQTAQTRYMTRYFVFGRGSRKLRPRGPRRRLDARSAGVSQVLPGMWVVTDASSTPRKPAISLMGGSNRSR